MSFKNFPFEVFSTLACKVLDDKTTFFHFWNILHFGNAQMTYDIPKTILENSLGD